MFLLYHAYVYLEFLILACTIYILAPPLMKAPHEEPSTTMLFFMPNPHERPSTTLANPQQL